MKINKPLFSKVLIAMFCCFLATTGYGQSKEETITWLKEKLAQSLTGTNSSVKEIKVEGFSECQFIIKYRYGIFDQYILTIPTKDLTIKEDGEISFELDVILEEELQSGSSTTIKKYRNSSFYINVANRETDLYNRIVKAFKHLATFCPQKKETF